MSQFPNEFTDGHGEPPDYFLRGETASGHFNSYNRLPFESMRSRLPSEDFAFALHRRLEAPLSPLHEPFAPEKSEPHTPFAYDPPLMGPESEQRPPRSSGVKVESLANVGDTEERRTWRKKSDEEEKPVQKVKKVEEVSAEGEGHEEGMDGEVERLFAKVKKTITYWSKTSRLIPNVFKLTRLLEEEVDSLFEHQDLSMKELLVMNYSHTKKNKKPKAKVSKDPTKNVWRDSDEEAVDGPLDEEASLEEEISQAP